MHLLIYRYFNTCTKMMQQTSSIYHLKIKKTEKNKAVIDNRLCPRFHIVMNSTKHCSCLTLRSVLAASAELNL